MITTRKHITNKKTWWEQYQLLVPSSILEYIQQENKASHISTFEPLHIPGLLQTESYAQMALSQAGMYQFEGAAIEDRVKLRMERQWRVMDGKNPPQIIALLDEAALHRHAHSAEVLREQLLHLAELAELPNITIRVIPFGVGLYAGMDAGSFTLTTNKNSGEENVFLGDYCTRSDNKVEVYMHKQLYESMLRQSLSPDESLRLIRATAQDL